MNGAVSPLIVDISSGWLMKRAKTYDEIKPLIRLCKQGKLFEVREWISKGKPVNPPPPPQKGNRSKSPLEVAIDCGFHSLVLVLLEGGAAKEEFPYSAIEQALSDRRLDLVKLLVEYGADIHSVDMTWVFDTWEPEIMKYFIENGADVETGYPLAWAFISRIRTALGIFKTYKDRFSTFQDQVNIALRYHCRDGNMKWVSLMLWAGGDPYARGPYTLEEETDLEKDWNALEYAAFHGHFDIFRLKQIRLDPSRPDTQRLLSNVCYSGKAEFLRELLDRGLNPIDRENGGSSLMQSLLQGMGWALDFDIFEENPRKNIDTIRTREKMKMIHILAKQGAKWVPNDRSEIAEARRALLRLLPDYTVEFIWIMSKYSACKRKDIEELIRTPAIRVLIRKHQARINELMETLQSDYAVSPCDNLNSDSVRI